MCAGCSNVAANAEHRALLTLSPESHRAPPSRGPAEGYSDAALRVTTQAEGRRVGRVRRETAAGGIVSGASEKHGRGGRTVHHVPPHQPSPTAHLVRLA